MDGQGEFLDLLLGNGSEILNTAGEINFYVAPERDLNNFDQQLEYPDTMPEVDTDFLESLNGMEKLVDEVAPLSPEEDLLTATPGDLMCVPSASPEELSPEELSLVPNVFIFPDIDLQNAEVIEVRTQSIEGEDASLFQVASSPFSPSSPVSVVPDTPDSAMSECSSSASSIIKHSLKSRIQTKRKLQGKEALKVDFTAPPPEQLTEEELELRRIKREKNKMAAQKCREKKRERADLLEEQTKKLQIEQKRQKLEIEKLIEERNSLMDLLQIHSSVCPGMRKNISSILSI